MSLSDMVRAATLALLCALSLAHKTVLGGLHLDLFKNGPHESRGLGRHKASGEEFIEPVAQVSRTRMRLSNGSL